MAMGIGMGMGMRMEMEMGTGMGMGMAGVHSQHTSDSENGRFTVSSRSAKSR